MSDDGATIIQFPKKHGRPEILNDEIAERWERGKKYFVEEMTVRYCEQAIEGLVSFGIDTEDPKYTKDIAYLTTVASGIFAKFADMPHGIHITIDSGAEVKDCDGNLIGYTWEPLANASSGTE